MCHLRFGGGVTVPFHAPGELRQSGSVVHPLWGAASSLPKAERTEVTTGGESRWMKQGGMKASIESLRLKRVNGTQFFEHGNFFSSFFGVKMG